MSGGTRRWKPYPAYKDSGVKWLGQVPEGWEVMSLKRKLRVVSGTTPKTQEASYWGDDHIWITPADLGKSDKFYLTDSITKISNDGLVNCGLQLVPSGSIIISIRAPIGSLGIAKLAMCTNQGCKSLILLKEYSSEFLAYFLSSVTNELNMLGAGSTFKELSGEKLGSFLFPVPSYDEQRAIATFLDQQCAQIDALITNKRRMLELLDEKRRAIITQAVTRGLDPSVPLKDSGVEWLGQVPEGWEVKRLKFCVSSGFQYGANIAAELDDTNLPRYIRITDMNDDGTLKDETFRSLPVEEAAPYFLRDKDILLARSGATVGKSFIYYESMGSAAYAGYLIRIAVSKDLSSRYIYAFLNSQSYWQWIGSVFIQATIQNVSAEKYANFTMTVPPLAEQRAIADYLDAQTAALDAQRESLEKSIDLLREYRASLITHAVTGKIDVRDFVPVR